MRDGGHIWSNDEAAASGYPNNLIARRAGRWSCSAQGAPGYGRISARRRGFYACSTLRTGSRTNQAAARTATQLTAQTSGARTMDAAHRRVVARRMPARERREHSADMAPTAPMAMRFRVRGGFVFVFLVVWPCRNALNRAGAITANKGRNAVWMIKEPTDQMKKPEKTRGSAVLIVRGGPLRDDSSVSAKKSARPLERRPSQVPARTPLVVREGGEWRGAGGGGRGGGAGAAVQAAVAGLSTPGRSGKRQRASQRERERGCQLL